MREAIPPAATSEVEMQAIWRVPAAKDIVLVMSMMDQGVKTLSICF